MLHVRVRAVARYVCVVGVSLMVGGVVVWEGGGQCLDNRRGKERAFLGEWAVPIGADRR